MSVKTIMFEIEGLIKNAVMSCAAMYGFSAEEALAKIDSNGNLIKPVVDKEAEKAKKDAEKAEKQRAKEAEKIRKDVEKAFVEEQKEAKKALVKLQKESRVRQKKEALVKEKKEALKNEKIKKEALINQQKAELASMKEEDILSKAAEKLALKQKKEAEKAKKTEKKPKKVKMIASIEPTPIIKSASKDEEPFIRFQNIPLMSEINSIRDVKKFKNYKKLSAGVKLARQIMDI
jgi:hypothetical protein